MSEEVWVPIAGFAGYEVSDAGRVRSLLSGDIHMLKCRRSTYNGYVMIGMRQGNRGQRTMRLHAVVAKAFVSNPDPLTQTQVDHRDGDRLNNAASNLEWVSPSENRRRAVARGTSCAATNPNFRFKLTAENVAEIKRRVAAGHRHIDIAADLGITNSHVSRISRGVAWNHSHLQALPVAPGELREAAAKIAEGYAKGCVTNHVCARIAADIRALGITVTATADAPENTSPGDK